MDNKKKLLIATDSFLPRWDGISRVLEEILPRISEIYEVTVLAPKFPGKKPSIEGVKIITYPIRKFRIGDYSPPHPNIISIRRHVKQSDIVWGQTIGPIGFFTMQQAFKQKKPLLAYIHSVEWELFSESMKRGKFLIKLFFKYLVKKLYNKCDLIMIPSETVGNILNERGIKSKKSIVPLGVDTERFMPIDDKSVAKRDVGLPKDAVVIGYLGRFGREKGLATLYKAFRALAEDYSDIRLLCVGGDKEYLEDFNDLDRIKIVGTTENPEKYYRAMDIYVLPSLTETTSLTTLEAMSSGIPVVCTSVGMIPEYVRNGSNGFLFSPGNSERLKLILKKLINNPTLRNSVAKNARRTVVSGHSWNKTIDSITKILYKYD